VTGHFTETVLPVTLLPVTNIMILTIIVFILTLGILVISHELGHFLAAKKFGIKVLEFGFGIPPRVWGKKIGETVWSLNWLPIGGFVRLLGEDDVDKEVLEDKRSFAYQPAWQRIIVVVAGVCMNLLLAVILFSIVLAAQGYKEQLPLLKPYQFWGVNQQNSAQIIIADVASDSPAAIAGLQKGDKVVAFNGQPLNLSQDFINLTKQHAGAPITVTVTDLQDQNRHDVTMTPRQNPPAGQGALGVALSSLDIAYLSYPTLPQKVFGGVIHSVNIAGYSLSILGDLFAKAFEEKSTEPVEQTLSGPIGITNIANAVLQIDNPLIPYLDFMGVLSLNLAVFNILPFPALDGGRLFFLVIEAVTRKKVSPRIEKNVHAIGMAVLLTLMVLITFSDLRKIFF
jgi:regulator of sigma E protease